MLLTVIAGTFIFALFFLDAFQNKLVIEESNKDILVAVSDVKQDINDAADNAILLEAEKVKSYYIEKDRYINNDKYMSLIDNPTGIEDKNQLFLSYLASLYDLTELSISDNNGIIIESTVEDYIGFDFHSGEQAREFLCLLNGTESFVQKYQAQTIDQNVDRKYAGVAIDGGFIQVGYDHERFELSIDSAIYGATKNRHIAETGYVMVLDSSGNIVSSPYIETIGKNIEEYGFELELLESKANREPYIDEINGEKYNCIGDTVEGYLLFGIIPLNEPARSIKETLIVVDTLMLIAFGIIYFQVYRYTKILVTDKIYDIAGSLQKIADGDFDVEVDVGGTAEFRSLSDNINRTVEALRAASEAEKEKIESELNYAKEIQRNALPSLFPPFPDRSEFEIYALMDPAREVGGDFFDFELLDGHELCFCVADVSGKGIPAALFMMRAKTLIKSYAISGLDPAQILTNVNNDLSDNNEAGIFLTCWLGILNVETGRIVYANAGHNPPLIKLGNRKFDYLRTNKPDFVLAGMEGIKYIKFETVLNYGDELFVYTDGVTEATDNNSVLFGEDRFKDSLNRIIDMNCQDKCEQIRRDIDSFVGSAPQFDDITMLSLKYLGKDDTLTVEATMENYDTFIEFIEKRLNDYNCPVNLRAKISIAVDELYANIANYAYGDEKGFYSVRVDKCTEPKDGVILYFLDHGTPFNPLDAPDPDTTLSADERPEGRLGIFLVKKLMDKVEYQYSYGNRLKITKFFN